MVCREAVEVASDYVEGVMNKRARQRYEGHLAACPHCTEYLQQIRDVIASAGRVQVEDLSPAARAGLLGVYRAWKIDPAGAGGRD
jgi:anti-sigma factor RsiW